jgi:thioesterase domain-containing protein
MAAGELVDRGGVPIGRPIAGTVVRVVDRGGQLCPIGVPGELQIGGAGLARGYLNNPGLTARHFIPDLWAEDSCSRLYKSGDLVSWEGDGTLAFHGRIDQQIKLRGFRIEPGEIESQLLRHPWVSQVCVLLHRDEAENGRLIAYWVASASASASASGAGGEDAARADGSSTAEGRGAKGGSGASSDELRAFLVERLPESMVPAAFVELAELPLTRNGKLDRQALPAPSFGGEEAERIEPRTELEQQLHGLWAEILGHDDFGITDNFFLVGGHSLAAARLIQRMTDARLTGIGIAALFLHPTIAALAQLIVADQSHHPTRCLVTLQPSGEAPPLFVIHGGSGDVFVFLALARALAPDRPVHGLQAVGLDGHLPRHTSVEQMAATYAAEIRACYPSGPYHLLGYSAGGWYAHAVAAELLALGGSIGLLAVVDTGATADLHRRVRAPMVARHLLQRLPLRIRELVNGSSRDGGSFLRQRIRAIRFHLAGMRRQQPISAPEDLETRAVNPTLINHPDYYVKVQTLYRPPLLPVAVDVIATRSSRLEKEWVWRFYARRGMRWHPVLERHDDFYNASLMPLLADLLRDRLADREIGLASAHSGSAGV